MVSRYNNNTKFAQSAASLISAAEGAIAMRDFVL
jgi:hypothetical protein